MTLVFDDYDFEQTARVVLKMNKHMDMYTHDELVSFMKRMAHEHLHDKNSTLSTGGFLLSSFTGSDGLRHVRASVTASLVDDYMAKVEDKIRKCLQPI